MLHLPHRDDGYKLIKGHGLEIGAFNQPAELSKHCTVEYCDAHSKQELAELFKEMDPGQIVDVHYVFDIDSDGLSKFENDRFDFLVFNHVIEHIANPIKALSEIFRVVKPYGLIVLSVPDKNFTFDKSRSLTPFDHLLEEFQNNVVEISDEHYIDFLINVHPELKKCSPEEFKQHVNFVKQRREHAHVWDTESFVNFLEKSFRLLSIRAHILYQINGNQSGLEYFSVLQKLPQ